MKILIFFENFENFEIFEKFEIEKICAETNTMSYQSYLNCRNYSFIVKLLNHRIFSPIYKLTQKLGISWYDFSKKFTNTIQDKKFQGKFKDIYNGFCKESHEELFDSKEEAIEFYSKPENYKYIYDKTRTVQINL